MPLPLSVLTGFLGSGKTTLLARMIRSESFRNTAVIINEFGEVGLDHVLVNKGEEGRAVLLDSGCLCCAMDGSLQSTLQGLLSDRDRALIPRFDRIVIETSGLADPGPIVNTLDSDRFIARHFRLGSITATVDAVFGSAQLKEFEEAGNQIAIADQIILTKMDLADSGQRDATIAGIRKLNPWAPVLESSVSAVLTAQLLGAALFPSGRKAALPLPGEAPHHEHTDHHLGHIESHGIRSHVLRFPEVIPWPRYAIWVRHLQTTLGERLLRLKGILALDDGQIYAIHAVRHLFGSPEELSGSVPPDLVGSVVLITQNVSDDEIAACDSLLREDEAQF